MFGSVRQARLAEIASDAITGILGPLSMRYPLYGQLPKAIFEDAYVLGFLQTFAMAVVNEVNDSPMHPRKQRRLFVDAIHRISPDSAIKLPRLLLRYNQQDHPLFNYLHLGKLEAAGYVEALLATEDTDIHRYIGNFYAFICDRYLPDNIPNDSSTTQAHL